MARTSALRQSVILVAVATSGCSPDGGARAVRDDPEGRPNGIWQVSVEPLLSIGREDGPDEVRFNRIRRVTTLPDGNILIVNAGGPPGLRVVNRDAEVVAAFGGQGAGPGEFGVLYDAWFVPPDTVVAYDYRHHRATWYLTNGEHLRDELLTHLMAQQLIVRGRYTDGSWLLASNVPEFEDRTEGRVTRRMLANGAPDGSRVDSIGYFDEMTRSRSGTEFRTQAFMPGVGTYVAIGDRLYAGYPDDYEIQVLTPNGALLQTIRRDQAARELTDEIFDAFAEARIEAAAPDQRPRVRRDLQAAERPDNLPAFSGNLTLDAEGILWIQEFVLPWAEYAAWSVFDGGGTYLGDVHLPAAFTPMEITDRKLLGVWRNELDIETIREYELTR